VKTLAAVLTAVVALEHLGFLGLEMFAWTLPVVAGLFGTATAFIDILFIQALPAALAFVATLAAQPRAAAASPT